MAKKKHTHKATIKTGPDTGGLNQVIPHGFAAQISVEMERKGNPLGTIWFSGAHVYWSDGKKMKCMNLTDFADIMNAV